MLTKFRIGLYTSYTTSDGDVGGDTTLNVPECSTENKNMVEPILITAWHTGAGNYDIGFMFQDQASQQFSAFYLVQAAVPPNTPVNITSALRGFMPKIGGPLNSPLLLIVCKAMGLAEEFHYCSYGRRTGGYYGYKLGV